MATTLPNAQSEAAMSLFHKQTGRYGPITMIAAMVLSVLAPVSLIISGELEITSTMLWTAFFAVTATFIVMAIIEPITYFPVLGPAAMYQAFMIGNISNKLLPAAVVGQASIGAKPGTKRGDLAAVIAICGAASVHLVSLLVLVGFLGTWLVSLIPDGVIEVTRLYILPSLMGAVLVQTIVAMKNVRATIVALCVALFLHFVLVLLLPQLALFITALAVALSITISWLARDRKSALQTQADD